MVRICFKDNICKAVELYSTQQSYQYFILAQTGAAIYYPRNNGWCSCSLSVDCGPSSPLPSQSDSVPSLTDGLLLLEESFLSEDWQQHNKILWSLAA